MNRLAGDPLAPKVAIKDIMTFGSPRTGLVDFADKFGANIHTDQKSWRFATDLDPITMVPPRKWNYTHVDAGYTLYKDGTTEPIPSERKSALRDEDDGEPENAGQIGTPHGWSFSFLISTFLCLF